MNAFLTRAVPGNVPRAPSLRRVVCAVTFAPSARSVIEWAVALAAFHGAEVRLFHVLPQDKTESPEEGDRVLQKLFTLARHLPGRLRLSAAVTTGDTAAEIARHSRLLNADVIALGSGAEPGADRSLVRRVTAEASCPVLVVPGGDALRRRPRSEAPPIRHIVCAVDFLPASVAALTYAGALARSMGAELTAVHVARDAAAGPDSRQLLRTTVRDLSGEAGNVTEVVASGRPCVEIVRVVRDCAADLVVMGADRSAHAPHRFGWTTECVMKCAAAPVLIISEGVCSEPAAAAARARNA